MSTDKTRLEIQLEQTTGLKPLLRDQRVRMLQADVIFPTDGSPWRKSLTIGAGSRDGAARGLLVLYNQQIVGRIVHQPVREKLPRSRRSRTFEFRVADCKGFVTVGEYDNGAPGEMFLRVSKQGSTLAGIMDAFAIAVSHGLQYGVPLRAYVEAFVGMRFEPAGMTDDPDLRIATSVLDYLFRKLSLMYLSPEQRSELNIFSTDERRQPTLPGVLELTTETRQGMDITPDPAGVPVPPVARTIDIRAKDAPLCMGCGNQMVRAGSCYACEDCGATSGCS